MLSNVFAFVSNDFGLDETFIRYLILLLLLALSVAKQDQFAEFVQDQ